MRKSARTQIPPFFDNDPYILYRESGVAARKLLNNALAVLRNWCLSRCEILD